LNRTTTRFSAEVRFGPGFPVEVDGGILHDPLEFALHLFHGAFAPRALEIEHDGDAFGGGESGGGQQGAEGNEAHTKEAINGFEIQYKAGGRRRLGLL
jgi:hypothetical protein